MAEETLPPFAQKGLRVFQWNILVDSNAPGCIDEPMRGYVADPQCLEWSRRCRAIARRVEASRADVVYLEECSQAMLSDLMKELVNYQAWHAGDLDGGLDSEMMEVALLVRSATIELLGTPRCRRLHWLVADGKEHETIMLPGAGDFPPSAYVVLSVAVKARGKGEEVYVVAGTHLRYEFGSGFGEAAAGKPLQALAAARQLRQHAVDAGAAGWALLGDFNSQPDDAVPVLLTGGRLAAEHEQLLGRLDSDLVLPFDAPLVSAWGRANSAEPLYTRKKNTVGSQYCLDYVFVGGRLTPTAASFGAGPPPYAAPDGSDLPCLPNDEWPSDHLPVVADLGLLAEC